MSVPSVFGAAPSAPVPFAPAAPTESKDFGPSIGKAKELEAHIGHTLVIDVVGPVDFEDRVNGGTATAIDAKWVLVVETGERFESQRLFPKGIVNQLKSCAGQTIIAAVGTYSTERFPNRKFVQLEAPTPAQVAAAQAAISGAPAAPSASSDAPF